MKKIPDRWLDYKAIGNVVEGSNFIAFKVPLHKVSVISCFNATYKQHMTVQSDMTDWLLYLYFCSKVRSQFEIGFWSGIKTVARIPENDRFLG